MGGWRIHQYQCIRLQTQTATEVEEEKNNKITQQQQ